ncbi:hypothetical protein CVD25_23075 [Bacillus canaveralius]|uniref:Group-specific protein n=1 Tax=Bacillus canaveralius TaxID=1403243 RepID=A0A2N5GI37_9BACI|nr:MULTISPECIES: hypothetical protein [Bacillus]PLR80093.1 hypothetical protein CVD23_21475 [Bacillus sp. V33-4]PLR80526.1 hypothetical protein CU635_18005 [Bacillus canaveralius]PLR88014.1 hypothetical protein CVD25_23075 [Bacillus canaveralius]
MADRNHIKQLCSKFKGKEYGLVEFQNRLETAIFPDELEGFKHSLINELEEIRFTKLEENFYHLGLEVVEKILNRID